MNAFFIKIKQFLKLVLGRASIVDIVPLSFIGWKMATGTRTPWLRGGSNAVSQGFASCDSEMAALIASGQVVLTQFRPEGVNQEVAGLKWRHYIVYWSAVHAVRNVGLGTCNFAEIGVCDGLTAWYASRAQRDGQGSVGEFFLYDAWKGMRADLLTSTEKSSTGSYAYLDIANTRHNLALSGADNFVFNKGYVPESFALSRNPDTLAWLHIDLNSALPTIAALDFFWERLLPGGVILLDDFAWPGYEETQSKVESWCSAKQESIMHLPTGQALIFKQGML